MSRSIIDDLIASKIDFMEVYQSDLTQPMLAALEAQLKQLRKLRCETR